MLGLGIVVRVVEQRGPSAKRLPGTPLRELGTRAQLHVGTAVDDVALEREPGYRKALDEQFSSVTPENAMKWGLLEPRRGDWQWAGSDRIVDFAAAHGQQVRGHTLVWWNQLPEWVQKGDWTRTTLRQAVREHIRAVVDRYRGKVGTWDVVNEPLDEHGRLRDDLLTRTLGDGWIEDAFRTARAGDPQAKLVLNETAADGIGPKSDGLYRLVRALLARGVPIDGVGLQAHFNLDGVPRGFRENLARFAALGLDVAVTELDVALPAPPSDADLRAQQRIYRDAARDCLAVARCRSLTVWGFTDRHSWIGPTQPGFGAADILDDQLRAKPAFRGLQRALSMGR